MKLDAGVDGRGGRRTASRPASAATRSCGPRSSRSPRDDAADRRLPSVEGTVETSLYLGTSTQIVVRLAGDVPMTVLVPNADEAERAAPARRRRQVRLTWAPEHMHLVA